MSEGYYLSLSDLLLIDDFPKVFSLDDKEKIEKFLFDNGLNTNEPYDQEVVTHRNLQNQIVTCLRFIGRERRCREWLNTGAASLGAWVESSDDLSFRAEMRSLSREVNKSIEREYTSNNYNKE